MTDVWVLLLKGIHKLSNIFDKLLIKIKGIEEKLVSYNALSETSFLLKKINKIPILV